MSAAIATPSGSRPSAKNRVRVIDLALKNRVGARAAAARQPHWAFREERRGSAVDSRKYFDEETELHANGARFMDPGTGAFTGPDPLTADPRTRGPIYAYANNNPIRWTDPSGLFVLKDNCANWQAALTKAKSWAGCGTGPGGGTNTTCECQYQLAKNACNVCEYLEEGKGPDAYVKSWGIMQNRAHTNVGAAGSMYTAVEGHPEASSVAFAQRFCSDPSNVDDLAELMLHEAAHYCGAKTGKPVREDVANNTARVCRKKAGGPIEAD